MNWQLRYTRDSIRLALRDWDPDPRFPVSYDSAGTMVYRDLNGEHKCDCGDRYANELSGLRKGTSAWHDAANALHQGFLPYDQYKTDAEAQTDYQSAIVPKNMSGSHIKAHLVEKHRLMELEQ